MYIYKRGTAVVMKSDVPFIGTPVGYAVNLSVMMVACVIILIGEPTFRPGLIECILAITFDVPSGIVLGKEWILFLRKATEAVPSKLWLKWAAHLVYPASPLGPQTRFHLLLVMVWILGMAAIYVTLALLRTSLETLPEPWTRLGSITLWEDMARTFIPYFLAWQVVLTVIGLRWYNSLEE